MWITFSLFLRYSYFLASVQCENPSHNDKSFTAIPNMTGSIVPKWFGLRLGVHWKKLHLGKNKLQEISIFCPVVVATNYLNTSPGSTLGVLCHFSLCANLANKTLSPIMTPLPRIWTPNTLILCQTAFSQPLGHPDGGHNKAVIILA
jgi:hypothetical protein